MGPGERKNSYSPSDLRERLCSVESMSKVRTPHGKKRVSTGRGGAGEKIGFFSVLREVHPELRIRPILIGAGAQV